MSDSHNLPMPIVKAVLKNYLQVSDVFKSNEYTGVLNGSL